jgi:hypothetical protein
MPRRRRAERGDGVGRLLDHLGPERLDRAAQLVNTTEFVDVLSEAAGVLAEADDPRLRRTLVERYQALAQEPADDRGCALRTAIVRALRHVAQPADAPVLEHAAMTYEFMKPGRREVAGDLRRAALLCLHDVEPERAACHAVRLLTDDQRQLSGEPALTAARILRDQGYALPLYECVLRHPDCGAEVLAECLASLTSLPIQLVSELFMRLGTDGSDPQVLVALFDLVFAHPERQALLAQLHAFLRTTAQVDIYAFVVTSIAALRSDPLVAVLDELAREPQGAARKQEALGQALALLPHPR